jgi:hypothetical protein
VTEPRRLLVVANETVVGKSLIDAVRRHASEGDVQVTVVAPVTAPREGYVVYEDTRRASAGRRLDRSVELLREAGIRAHGLVVESDPVNATKDAIATIDPDEIIVSTHPQQKSGWLRRNVVDKIRSVAGDIPVEHVVVDLEREPGAEANVLVVANETVVGEPLLAKIRERAAKSPASFLLLSPQSDEAEDTAHPEAERRLRRAIASLRADGIDVHGQVAHPDPYAAAMHAVQDERIDEIIVSTFPSARSGWLRRDLVERLKSDAGVPVEHVVVEPAAAEAGVAS